MSDNKKDISIAEKIRKSLLNLDLRIVYGNSQYKTASEDYKLFSKLSKSKSNKRKALNAKIKQECYKVYIKNISNVKEEVSLSLDKILSRYSPKFKEIWYLYFLQKEEIDTIANKMHYSRRQVNRIVAILKDDLINNYEEELAK